MAATGAECAVCGWLVVDWRDARDASAKPRPLVALLAASPTNRLRSCRHALPMNIH